MDLLNCMCYHTEIEAADQTWYLTQNHSILTPGQPVPALTLMAGARQGSHWRTSVYVTGMTPPGKSPTGKVGIKPRSAAFKVDTLPLGQWGGVKRAITLPSLIIITTNNNNNNSSSSSSNNGNNNHIEKNNSRFFFFFCNLLTASQTVSNMYAQVARAQSCANHVQHIERLSCATCWVPLGMKGQLSC